MIVPHSHICVSMFVSIYVCMHVCICMYVCMYIYVCVCVCVCACVCACGRVLAYINMIALVDSTITYTSIMALATKSDIVAPFYGKF